MVEVIVVALDKLRTHWSLTVERPRRTVGPGKVERPRQPVGPGKVAGSSPANEYNNII